MHGSESSPILPHGWTAQGGFMALQAILAAWTPRFQSVLRIVTAALYLEHGTMKLLRFPMRPSPPPGAPPMGGGGPPGPPPDNIMSMLGGMSGYFELIGGILLLFGIFSR